MLTMLVNKLREYKRFINYLNKLFLIFLITFLFIYVYYTFYKEIVYYFKGNIILIFLYVAIFVVFSLTYGSFRIGLFTKGELFLSHSLSMVITNIIMYFVMCLIQHTMLNCIAIILMTIAQIVIGVVFYVVANKIYFFLYPVRNCVAIGSSIDFSIGIFEKFHRLKERFNIELILDENDGLESLKEKISSYSTVILGSINKELRKKLISYCFEKDIRLYVEPTISDIMLHNAHEMQVDDSIVYLNRNRGPSLEQLVIKRTIDILVSITGLIAFSPVMLVIGILIKLYDRGTVFYKQKRLTLNGREFDIIKFRSMIENAEKDGIARLASKHDKRITPIGKFIRMTRLDELPQIINILKGDMSLVGPRPERPEIIKDYSKQFPAFKYRLKMKAGLTGYAQIYGKYNTTFKDKVKMDLIYIMRYSILLDIQLIFATIKTVFMKNSTEGIDQDRKLHDLDDEYDKSYDETF